MTEFAGDVDSAIDTERLSFTALFVLLNCAPRSWSTKLIPFERSLFKRLGGGGGGGGGTPAVGGSGGAGGGWEEGVETGAGGTAAVGGTGAMRDGLAFCCCP